MITRATQYSLIHHGDTIKAVPVYMAYTVIRFSLSIVNRQAGNILIALLTTILLRNSGVYSENLNKFNPLNTLYRPCVNEISTNVVKKSKRVWERFSPSIIKNLGSYRFLVETLVIETSKGRVKAVFAEHHQKFG